MKMFYNALEQGYAPETSFFQGRFTPCPEVAARTRSILQSTGLHDEFELVAPPPLDAAVLAGIHDAGYLETLRALCGRLKPDEAFYPFNAQPLPLLLRSPYPRVRMGYYALDTSTPVLPQTYDMALSAAAGAAAGAEAMLAGEPLAYCLMRPPGHHAGRRTYGGYCILNNAALAAQRLAGAGRVAILDVDYHHGNGTQDIFYESDIVLYVSLHCRPEEAYPYVAGAADEGGAGRGAGYNLNLPLPGGTDWAAYAPALERALERIAQARPALLVLSAGFDTLADDPIGSFALQVPDFEPMGRLIAALGLPTLVVQEGGYHVPSLGPAVLALFTGLGLLQTGGARHHA